MKNDEFSFDIWMLHFRRYVFQSLCESCDKVAMESIQPCEKSQENQQKKTKFENERQVLLMKEVDSVSNSDLTGREKYNQQLAQKYLDWIQKYCRRWYFELWTMSVCLHTLSPSLHLQKPFTILS